MEWRQVPKGAIPQQVQTAFADRLGIGSGKRPKLFIQTVRISVLRLANLNLPSNMIANWAFAMAHSRGGILSGASQRISYLPAVDN